jgi:hypothetical protein
MIPVNVTVTFDDRQLQAHLDALPGKIRQALRPVITELTNSLLNQVHALEPRRTGATIANTRAFVDEGETFIRGQVRVLSKTGHVHNIAAAVLEYGGHKSVAVHSYRRRTGPVEAYARRENIEAQRFLRGPAGAIHQRAVAEIKEAVVKAMQETITPTR